MAVTAIDAIRPFRGLSVPTFTGPEKASQSWVAGDILIADSTGYLAIGAASAETEIVGIAVHGASGVTGALAHYVPALPDIIFEINLDSTGATPLTSLQTHLYGDYGLGGVSGAFFIDVDTTSVFVPLAFVDAVGTAQARMLAVFQNRSTVWGRET